MRVWWNHVAVVHAKHKVFRETLNVTFDRLVQDFSLHIIQLRQVAVEHHTLPPHLIDAVLDDIDVVYPYL